MLVQFSNSTLDFQARRYCLPCETHSAIPHNPLTNQISLMCQCFLLQYWSMIWMYTLLTLTHTSKHSPWWRRLKDFFSVIFFVFQDNLKTSWTHLKGRYLSSHNSVIHGSLRDYCITGWTLHSCLEWFHIDWKNFC